MLSGLQSGALFASALMIVVVDVGGSRRTNSATCPCNLVARIEQIAIISRRAGNPLNDSVESFVYAPRPKSTHRPLSHNARLLDRKPHVPVAL